MKCAFTSQRVHATKLRPRWSLLRVVMYAAIGIVLVSLLASSTQAQSAPNHRLGTQYQLPDSVYESHGERRSRMTISRSAITPYERELLHIAERILPDSTVYTGLSFTPEWRREFERAASGIAREVPFSRPAEPRAAGERGERWWQLDFDGTFTPLAITGGAVRYYMERFHDIVQGRGQFSQPGVTAQDWVNFNHTARVKQTTDHDAQHVVVLSVGWDHWCSSMCSMSFSHARRVYFDAQGRVVHVQGDGSPSVVVS